MRRLVPALLVLVTASPALAGELQLELAPAVRKSSWRGDYGVGSQLRLAYRIKRVVAVDFVGWEELATVDRRVNTGLTFGVTGTLPWERYRPFARAFVIHQHEEGVVSVKDHPFDTALGIGPGIRHRAGAGGVLGVEVPLKKSGRVEWYAAGAGTLTWFPSTALGPGTYLGVYGGVGLSYSVEGLP